MYTIQDAAIVKIVKCHNLDDVKMMFNRIDFVAAFHCGCFKFISYSRYNDSEYYGIIELKSYPNTGAFTTYDQFLEFYNKWQTG